MDKQELAALVEQELAQSIGHTTGDLADARALELKFYNSEPFGNEKEGESRVVSSDVFDTVEGMLPSLLEIFTASDDVVRFDPQGPEDEQEAKQRTEVVNYVFYRQNNGFLVLYEWFKDALIQKNGVVKYWWEEKEVTTQEEYEGLSEGQYLKLKKGDGKARIEVLEESSYDDPTAIEERDSRLEQALAQINDQPLPPAGKRVLAERIKEQFSQIPIPKLYDLEIKITKDVSKICIETLPPEEFRISQKQRCISIQETVFCGHYTKKTVSELREMGVPEEILQAAGPSENITDTSTEALARERFLDERWSPHPEADPSLKEMDVFDGFMRVDFDGDGKAELRHIIKVGNEVWENEETDHICFAALTPIIMPHKWVGKSAAELVMSDQFTKSVIWRQMLTNLYLTNNPRKAVLSSPSGVIQANLDDLMNSRAGGIMREYVPNAIRNEETPFVAAAAFPMLEYIDKQKESRTSVTPYNQGTDADSLNKTARGIQMIQGASQKRLNLIARIFAETGVKDLMRGIAYYLSKYSSKAMTVRLSNNWVEIDPREWKNQFDMTVNVGLGTGNRDVQLAHLNVLGQKQLELMQTGRAHLVTDENVYNLYKKMSEAMGFKHPEIFVADPQTVQKPQPQPNPDLIKIQADAQIDQAKIQSNEKIRQFDAQTNKELEEIKGRYAMAIAQIQTQAQKEIAGLKTQADAQIEIFKGSHELEKEAKNVQLEKLELSYEKELLSLKKKLDDFVISEKERVAKEEQSKAEDKMKEHKEEVKKSVSEDTSKVQQKIGDMSKMMDNLAKMVAMQSETQKKLMETKSRPKVVKIGKLKTDDKGLITGAEISTE